MEKYRIKDKKNMNLQLILEKHKKWLNGKEGGVMADLRNADLRNADLRYAYLRYADLSEVIANYKTIGFHLACPEKSSFVGYKKATGTIVELLILEDSKRSSATSRKCRCDKAQVLSITSICGTTNFEEVSSDYNSDFIYRVGEIVSVPDFDADRWNECSTGIHFFITRDEAVEY